MAKVDAAGWLTKWGTRLNGSGSYMKSGAQAVTVAPGTQAAAAQDRMLSNLTTAVTSGIWAKRVSSVTLQQWQNAYINKGIANVPAGVTQAQATKTQTITNLLTAVDAAAAQAKSLPKGGIAQSIARASAFMTAMNQAKANIKP